MGECKVTKARALFGRPATREQMIVLPNAVASGLLLCGCFASEADGQLLVVVSI